MANSRGSGTPDAEPDEPPEDTLDDGGVAKINRTLQILADGDRRDDEATARDLAADKRAKAADLQAFLNTDEDYAGHGERRAAARDRAHSKGDREKSADDRAHLSAETDTDREGRSSETH